MGQRSYNSGMRLRAALASLLVGSALGLVQAQSPQPPPPAPGQPTFRSGVTMVTTDVIVRTRSGNFVGDLTKDDFTVLEDGQPQTITSFTMVNGGRVFNLLAPAPVAADEGIVLPPPKKAPETGSGRVLIVFIDDLHFEVQFTPHVRRIVQQMVDTLLHDGDIVAMVSSGPSAIEISPTSDRKLVASAITQIRGTGLTASDIFQMLESSQGPGDLRYRAQVAFQTMYNMVAALDQVQNRRKAIVFISQGYDFDPYAEGRNSRDRVMGGRFSEPTRFLQQNQDDNPYYSMSRITADIDLYAYMRELTLQANRTNASIFTIDPRGLAGVTDAGQYVDQSEVRTYLQKTISTLRYMAEETGGFAVVNDNDFVSAFKRIDAETSDYYVIGYTSSNPDPSVRVRNVDVKVARPDVEVSSRKSYSLKATGPLPRLEQPPAVKLPKKKR
jgi:VWFA-related protein